MSLYNKIIDLQKLNAAWRQVYRNKPKEGVDEITCEAFDENKSAYLKELFFELRDHQYECLPVKLVTLYKGEKARQISMFSMRDKTVQNSIAQELNILFEPSMSDASYAYRNGKSALVAAQIISDSMKKMGEGYALKTDITAFFDNIDHNILRGKLSAKIAEDDVMELIFKSIKAPSLETSGELIPKSRGLYHGSSISPVLSNIYMMEFDKQTEADADCYIRYSDDIIALFKEKKKAEAYLDQIKLRLEKLGLELSMHKTTLTSFDEGFVFLGYRFGKDGISAAKEEEEQLTERLEKCWMENPELSFKEKIKKADEIFRGWEQYFRWNRECGSMVEFLLLADRVRRKKQDCPDNIKELRHRMENTYHDAVEYLVDFWESRGESNEAIREYEDYLGLVEPGMEVSYDQQCPQTKELADALKAYYISQDEENRLNLVQIYADLKQYKKSEMFQKMSYKNESPAYGQHASSMDITALSAGVSGKEAEDSSVRISMNDEQIEKYMDLFVGREDIYVTDELSPEGSRKTMDQLHPLVPDVIKKHLKGEETIGTYIQRTNSTVKYLVLDLDISRRVFLQQEQKKGEQDQGNRNRFLENYLKKCMNIAIAIKNELRKMGIDSCLEFSGCRGTIYGSCSMGGFRPDMPICLEIS